MGRCRYGVLYYSVPSLDSRTNSQIEETALRRRSSRRVTSAHGMELSHTHGLWRICDFNSGWTSIRAVVLYKTTSRIEGSTHWSTWIVTWYEYSNYWSQYSILTCATKYMVSVWNIEVAEKSPLFASRVSAINSRTYLSIMSTYGFSDVLSQSGRYTYQMRSR